MIVSCIRIVYVVMIRHDSLNYGVNVKEESADVVNTEFMNVSFDE